MRRFTWKLVVKVLVALAIGYLGLVLFALMLDYMVLAVVVCVLIAALVIWIFRSRIRRFVRRFVLAWRVSREIAANDKDLEGGE